MNFRNFGKRKLPREHDALRALLLPKFCGVLVGRVRLRGNVQRQFWRDLPGERKGAGVGHQRRVRADLLQIAEIVGKGGEIGVFGEDVRRDVHLFPARMGILRRRAQFLRRKVIGKGAEGKILSAQIRRVRAEAEGDLQFFKIARWREQFDTFIHFVYQSEASLRPLLKRDFAAPSPLDRERNALAQLEDARDEIGVGTHRVQIFAQARGDGTTLGRRRNLAAHPAV